MDTERYTTDELETELRRLETLKRRIAAGQIALIAEIDRRQVATIDGCRTLVDWVSARLDVPAGDAAALVTLSRRLPDLPRLAGALCDGEVGVSRAEAITRIATASTEHELITRSAMFDLSGLKRWVNRHRRIGRDAERDTDSRSFLLIQPSLDESWWAISGGVGALAGAVIERAVCERADRLPVDHAVSRAHRQALALEALCADSLDGLSSEELASGSSSITAFVDLDIAAATAGEAGAEIAAGPRIGPDALQELWCTGAVSVVGLAGQRPASASPSTRTISPAVRRFVLWRDGGCRAGGCRSRYRLQPHHVHLRSHGGGHDPDNLVTLCWFHHHVVVHRRGYRIQLRSDGSLELVAPQASRDPP